MLKQLSQVAFDWFF